ncbi:mitogen-activated protein kinase, putative [Bodo saltans]|uniref:Mitogen-activated protein kinase, putative n=2 Tax=Bodo saltans TaxID=75058 RepID=A0A0S4JAS0_BODSA|nr:mitogen-activated protein kinase, putative [Bodo saltans]|eukprot:CUG86242.1 mitogen-activated protein kinase, putative [Bodo saltans]
MHEYALPRSIDDYVACRIFCSELLRQLPYLATKVGSTSSTTTNTGSEVLLMYLKKSLKIVGDFIARYEAIDVDVHVTECLIALQRELTLGFDTAANQLCEVANFLWDPAGLERMQSTILPTTTTMSGVVVVLCSIAALVLVATKSSLQTVDYVCIGLIGVSILLFGATMRLSAKQRHIALATNDIMDSLMVEVLAVASGGGGGKSSLQLPTNPLYITSSIVPAATLVNFEEDGHTNSNGATSFLVDPQEVLPHKAMVEAILQETDDDDGHILVRTRGFSKVSIALGALSKHLLLIVTDVDGRVSYWSDGAAFLCGFSARDAEGKHISSFLFGETSMQQYQKMTDAALSGVDPIPRILSVANLTHGSVAVRGSVVLAKNSDNEGTLGFVLLASSQEGDALRGLSQFHSYFLAQLATRVQRDDSSRRLLESLKWKALQDLAQSSRDWTSVLLPSLLSDVVKDRHRQCDVRVQPNVAELLVCDQAAVTRAIVQTLQLLGGKVRMSVSQRRVTDVVQQLVVQFMHSSSVNMDMLNEVRRNVVDIGCEILQDVPSGDAGITLCVPFVAEGTNPNDATRRRDELTKTAVVTPMTILLLEKNAVYRHNLSSVAWANGHSLRVVDSLSKALKAVNDSSVDLGCAIIDADIRESDKLFDALARHKVFTIATSESAEGATAQRGGSSFLLKPTSRVLLETELDRAAQSVREKKKADEEILKQREVFGKVRNSPWTRGKKLGRGAFADVFEATSTMTGGKMAVKMIRLVGGFKERVKDLMNEIEILCSLTHPHIIHYFYCERAETTINLFMELADEGSLADMLATQPRLTEEQAAAITKQLLLSVNYLHENNIIHRDIKPGNMLISKGKIKLSDFGTATNSMLGEGTQGTMFYMAPEVVDGNTYGMACDIWSIGCVLCETLGVKRQPRQNGLLGYGLPQGAYPADVSLTAQDFISLCLQDDASERPTAGSLLLHDFIVAKPESSQIGKHPPAVAASQPWGMTAEKSSANLSVSSAESRASW